MHVFVSGSDELSLHLHEQFIAKAERLRPATHKFCDDMFARYRVMNALANNTQNSKKVWVDSKVVIVLTIDKLVGPSQAEGSRFEYIDMCNRGFIFYIHHEGVQWKAMCVVAHSIEYEWLGGSSKIEALLQRRLNKINVRLSVAAQRKKQQQTTATTPTPLPNSSVNEADIRALNERMRDTSSQLEEVRRAYAQVQQKLSELTQRRHKNDKLLGWIKSQEQELKDLVATLHRDHVRDNPDVRRMEEEIEQSRNKQKFVDQAAEAALRDELNRHTVQIHSLETTLAEIRRQLKEAKR